MLPVDIPLGHLGDNESYICKTKWFSFKYNIPFLYQPLPYSDQLVMHTTQIRTETKSA